MLASVAGNSLRPTSVARSGFVFNACCAAMTACIARRVTSGRSRTVRSVATKAEAVELAVLERLGCHQAERGGLLDHARHRADLNIFRRIDARALQELLQAV